MMLEIAPVQLRDCNKLLAAIDGVCASDKDREACRSTAEAAARRLAPRLPWMHRTGRPGASWRTIFTTGRLAPSPVKPHETLDGRSLSVYFFVGACAFPKGNIVLVFHSTLPDWLSRATFTPFDTGSLAGFAEIDPADPSHTYYAPWATPQHCRYLQDHTGSATDLNDYLPPYLASHFRHPPDYVTRPQLSSPDYPPYHGLRSTTGDRRSWTPEIQLHGDSGATLDSETLLEIFVLGKDRFDALPAIFKGMARLIEEDDSIDSPPDLLATTCAEWTLQHAQETIA